MARSGPVSPPDHLKSVYQTLLAPRQGTRSLIIDLSQNTLWQIWFCFWYHYHYPIEGAVKVIPKYFSVMVVQYNPCLFQYAIFGRLPHSIWCFNGPLKHLLNYYRNLLFLQKWFALATEWVSVKWCEFSRIFISFCGWWLYFAISCNNKNMWGPCCYENVILNNKALTIDGIKFQDSAHVWQLRTDQLQDGDVPQTWNITVNTINAT